MIGPLKGRKKLKSAKQVAVERSQHAHPLSSPTRNEGVECARSDPVEASSRRPRLPRSGQRGRGSGRADSHVPTVGQQPTLEGLQDRLFRAEQEKAELQRRLKVQDMLVQQREMALKQSMMLDMLQCQRSAEKRTYALQKEVLYAKKEGREAKAEVENFRNQVAAEKERCTKALADMSMYRDEADHLQTLNKVLEEDLDELRRIENEEATHRRRCAAGLPPAYGSLDDDNYEQPHQHKDSGSLDVATFKRSIRADFERRLTASHSTAASMRLSGHAPEREVADSTLFVSLSAAVADACNNLKPVLEQEREVRIQYIKTELVKWPAGARTGPPKPAGSSQLAQYGAVPRKIARRSLVCDRVAKVIIDLCWRLLSACELHPTSINLSGPDKARVSLAHTDIDHLLLESLRGAFTLHAGYTESSHRRKEVVWEFQHCLTQVTSLREKFTRLVAGITYRYLDKSWLWLGEQVEMERMHLANSRDYSANAPSTGMRLDGNWEEVELDTRTGGSEISSNLDDSGTERSEGGV